MLLIGDAERQYFGCGYYRIRCRKNPILRDHIVAKSANVTIERNKRKSNILYRLRKTGKVNGISYRICFNSCNLEHVLYGELKDYSDKEKQIMSDDFAERYDGNVDESVEFISASNIAVQGTYQKTWDYKYLVS